MGAQENRGEKQEKRGWELGEIEKNDATFHCIF